MLSIARELLWIAAISAGLMFGWRWSYRRTVLAGTLFYLAMDVITFMGEIKADPSLASPLWAVAFAVVYRTVLLLLQWAIVCKVVQVSYGWVKRLREWWGRRGG